MTDYEIRSAKLIARYIRAQLASMPDLHEALLWIEAALNGAGVL